MSSVLENCLLEGQGIKQLPVPMGNFVGDSVGMIKSDFHSYKPFNGQFQPT